MSATHCIAHVQRELRAHKTLSAKALRGIAAQQPMRCNRADCTPGGCRKHVIEYLTGVAYRARIPMRKRDREMAREVVR